LEQSLGIGAAAEGDIKDVGFRIKMPGQAYLFKAKTKEEVRLPLQ